MKIVHLFFVIISLFSLLSANPVITELPKPGQQDKLPEQKPFSVLIPFSITPLNQIIAEICLGTPPQCLKFKIATNIDETFVYSNSLDWVKGFDITKSQSALVLEEDIEFTHASSTYRGYSASDTLSIKNTDINLEDFSFYVVKSGVVSPDYSGVLGLGKKYEDNEFSFVSMLYQYDYIDDQVFSLTYEPQTASGILKLGFHELSDNKMYKVCDIVEDDDVPYFEVTMDGIIYENMEKGGENFANSFAQPQVVLMSPGANNIYCPEPFYKFMVDKIFKEIINPKAKCSYDSREAGFSQIECENKILDDDLGEIRFIFGKWNINLRFVDLFEDCHNGKNNNVCFTIILARGENFKWGFGYPLLKQYPVVFDYDTFNIFVKIK